LPEKATTIPRARVIAGPAPARAGNGTGSGNGGQGQGGGGAVTKAVKIAGDINSARDYPRETRDQHIGDSVTVALTVGTDGRVKRLPHPPRQQGRRGRPHHLPPRHGPLPLQTGERRCRQSGRIGLWLAAALVLSGAAELKQMA
jgi:hypothetical protein